MTPTEPLPAADDPSPTEVVNFQAVAEATYDWESWHAPSGKVKWINPAVERFTGYTSQACLQMPDYPLGLIAPDYRTRVQEVLQQAAARGTGNDVEFTCLHRDGSERFAAISWQPMYDNAGAYLGYRTSVRDITERLRFREQLRLHAEHLEQLVEDRTLRIRQLETQRQAMEKLAALGQLAAGVAHEINNPLAGIRSAFELVKSGTDPQHEHYELLELIDSEIERISDIVHQMYQLYRPLPRSASPFAMDRAVADVMRLLGRIADDSRVRLVSQLPDHTLPGILPEGEVKQVLFNLVLNAIQASQPGQAVTIALEEAQDEILVRVCDHGVGIAAADLVRIFEPFYSTKEEDSRIGMGLGLSVSSSIMDALGGRMEVVSEPGVGSTFTARFPKQLSQP